MLTNLFTTPKSQPAQRLAELGARRVELLAQERDELTALDSAQDEHARLGRVIAEGEAKALALGKTAPEAKAISKLDKLAEEINERAATSDRLARAIVALDEEARETVRIHADELLNEAIALHDHARNRVAELVAELHEQRAALRSAYAAAQSIAATAGRSTLTARLRDTPSVETLVLEGGAPPLIHEDDRAIAA
jgi:hypothetical protein